METIFYKILHKSKGVIYIGVTTRKITERFKEHLKSKGLNPSEYSIVEFSRIQHPDFTSIEVWQEECKKVTFLEQKYIKEEKLRGSRLLNVRSGGEWGACILNTLHKEEFFKKHGSYSGYKQYRDKKKRATRWLKDWFYVRSMGKAKYWLNNWVATKGRNHTNVWLRTWVYSNKMDKTKLWIKTWVFNKGKNNVKSWLYEWTRKKDKLKNWLKNWVRHRKDKHVLKIWLYNWVSNKSTNKSKGWACSWVYCRSMNKTKYWLKNWIKRRKDS